MALTAVERLTAFEIFDFPPGATVVVMWGQLGQDQAVQQYSFRSPVEAVDALIALLSAAAETRLRELWAEWATVSTSERRLTRAEEIEGVVQDSAAKRDLIRQRQQVYLPVFLEGELAMRHAKYQMGGANRIARG